MANVSDKLRSWWDGLQPRERGMIAVLGITAVVSVFGFTGQVVQGGLAEIESANADKREVLALIHTHRVNKAAGQAQKTIVIPEEGEALDLEAYMNKAAKAAGVTFPTYNRGENSRGDYVETTGRIELKDISLDSLSKFLEEVERNPQVVTIELRIKQDFKNEELLDVHEMLVATYFKRGAEKGSE